MKGLLYILVSYLIGEMLSVLMGRFMPASVLGMLVLFLALRLKAVKMSDVRVPARLILNNMILFFIPIGVGIMTTVSFVGVQFVAIVVSVVVSTVLTLLTVGLIQQKFGKRS